MGNKIVGSVLVTSAPTDKIIVDRSGQFREMLVSSVGINHIELTSTVAGLKTYTLYRSADTSSVFGTIEVQDGLDGSDGTGLDIPDYDNSKEYKKNNTILDDDGYVYRFINSTPTSGQKPVNNVGVINGAYWQRLFIGQTGQIETLISDSITTNAAEYLVDTTTNPITLTVSGACNAITISDYGNTWTDTNFLTVTVGADSFEFKKNQSGIEYKFRRIGAKFRVSGSDNTVIWGNV